MKLEKELVIVLLTAVCNAVAQNIQIYDNPFDPNNNQYDPNNSNRFDPDNPNRFDPNNPNRFDPNNPNRYDPNNPNRFDSNNPSRYDPINPNSYDPNNPDRLDPNNPNRFDQNNPNRFDPNNPNRYDPNNPNRYDPNNPNRYDVNFPNRYDTNRFNPNTPNQYNPNDPNENPFDPNRNPSFSTNDYGGSSNPFTSESPFGRPSSPRTPWRQNPSDSGFGRHPIDEHTSIIREATYFVVASRIVRPGQLYRVSVQVFRTRQPLTVRASIQRNGVEMSTDHKEIKENIPETLLMRVPPTSAPGEYKLRVEGLYNDIFGGAAFINETKLTFSQRYMTIFIQMDKPVYMQGQTVRFRVIPINTELKAFNNAIDVYMLDPKGHIMKRWLSRQSNLGTVSLEYQLSDQPVFGKWKIKVDAQGQTEESTFDVEEYYQTRFEVNVTMPAFFFTTDEYIHGIVMANYTSGGPVRGNLTLKATVRPINPIRNWRTDTSTSTPYNLDDISKSRQQQQQDYMNPNYNVEYNEPPLLEKYFSFDEQLPFWISMPYRYYEPIPILKYFYGVYKFQYPLSEILRHIPTLDGMEVVITATVGERYLDEVIEGYSVARIYNSSLKLSFMGGSPQVFKPGMPISTNIVVNYHDGSPLSEERLLQSTMEVHYSVEMRGGGRRDGAIQQIPLSDRMGIWQYNIDLKGDLGLDGQRSSEELNDMSAIRIQAYFRDARGERANAELLLVAHESPRNKHIKISTSTRTPQVGEYIIFHIRSNYFIEYFNYMIMSKGMVLLAAQEDMKYNVQTMAVTLSAEMAPAATVVVWHVDRYGDVTADSLTFPVNGISRNKFTVLINNKKARTGHKVEVAIYGEPGSYVGLSGIDYSFFSMQAGNELTYSHVLKKMATFDEQTNGTHLHTWISHEGNPEEFVYFPSSTYGIDANRTFEYVGLVVFSDVQVPRRLSSCNYTLGYGECLTGRCYRLDKKCDGFLDCEDGTDEVGCERDNGTQIAMFRKNRFNRIQRLYDNVWCWKDVNIGPHGRYIFNILVPSHPVHWMVSAFSMSPSLGFGMLNRPLEYMGVLPFFINVEMPNECRQGEQVGIRVTVFNYMPNAIEATVVLAGSPDYKFVHVEQNGVVRAYNPRTSFGEHQFFIYIKQQDAEVVYLPIVPTRLGDIEVTVYASTLIGKDEVTRKLHVEADGLPQYRHQSMLLDLSNRAYAFQYMHVNVTETPIIPYEFDRYYVYGSNRARISIVGDVVGPIFPTMPVNATSMLNLPMDAADMNMFSFAANMYTTLYMRYTQQRNRTLERLAFYYMNIGYQRQLSFMKEDGSFGLFRSDWNHSASSVWLTAYCARVFQEASFYEWENYIYIDPIVISKAMDWVLSHQNEYGSFYETTWSPDRKYNDTLTWSDRDEIRHRNITLTAHVLITLDSVKDLQSGLSSKVAIAAKRAIQWLERNLDLLNKHGSPFEVAIVAYALMKSKAPNAETAFSFLARHGRIEGGLMYWGREPVPQPPYKTENQKPFRLPRLPYKYDSENIEATAYGLLVYVARQEIFVDYIVNWLNTQRLTDAGWASTSDTATALKALIEYTSAQRIRDISSLAVTVEATSLPGQSNVLYVNDKNRGKMQYIDIPNAWGTVKVQARGAGYAILQMSVQYNVDIARFQTQPPVPSFDLSTRAEFYGRNHSHVNFLSCQKWTYLNESERSGLAVLDVAVPTGYIIQQQKLDAYVLSRQVRNLQRAKFLEKKVLFYFDYLDNEEICINLTVERWYPVANMSRFLPIRVYDYHSPERYNESIFDALTTYLLNICEVCGSSQCPYCYIYNKATVLSVPIFTIFFTSFVLLVQHLRLQEGAVI
ncbi:CD109 antigen [Agrilus planipennis]|uniref:TEP1-F n=1 Tax=Agrilus planipennis TaxID=224129 RepID=A0A1W4WJK7_AGRPL|nr:CD109 antigen [Agrilus planipennis]